MPDSIPDMLSSLRETDESSRDSGFGEMDCDSMPVDFAHPSLLKKSSFQFKNLDMEMDDLVIEESLKIQTTNMICSKKEELEVKTVLSNMRSMRKGLADVTNSPRIFEIESPKSRKSVFAKPQCRAVSMHNNRKRALKATFLQYKRNRVDETIEEHEVLLNGPEVPPRDGHHNDSQAFRRIDARTLSRLMKSMSSQEFNEKYVLVDCRYPYEFNGGHIKGAINVFDTTKCEEVFYPVQLVASRRDSQSDTDLLLAQTLRSVDRQRNVDVYPKVDFPEIYVVDKGYRNFFETFADSTPDKHLFEPCNYVEMVDGRFAHHLRQYNFHKKSWGNSTCSKNAPPQSRMGLRQLSEGALDSPSNPGPSRPSRRPLFAPAPKTPEPLPLAPVRQLQFS
ncbi:rhodanese-like protein, partial [Ostertagia ostertagi]